MLKLFATEVIVSKGYDNAPALRFSEKGDSVRFRIGARVYDTRAEGNTRWVNLSVKAFGTVCDRVKRMQLKEGSRINLVGRFDEDVWEDTKTHEKKSASVIILDELEARKSLGTAREQPPAPRLRHRRPWPGTCPPVLPVLKHMTPLAAAGHFLMSNMQRRKVK